MVLAQPLLWPDDLTQSGYVYGWESPVVCVAGVLEAHSVRIVADPDVVLANALRNLRIYSWTMRMASWNCFATKPGQESCLVPSQFCSAAVRLQTVPHNPS
jgi:hypothetical protein